MPCNTQNKPGLWIPSSTLSPYLAIYSESKMQFRAWIRNKKSRLTDPTTSSDYLSKKNLDSHNNFPSLLMPPPHNLRKSTPTIPSTGQSKKKDELRIGRVEWWRIYTLPNSRVYHHRKQLSLHWEKKDRKMIQDML